MLLVMRNDTGAKNQGLIPLSWAFESIDLLSGIVYSAGLDCE